MQKRERKENHGHEFEFQIIAGELKGRIIRAPDFGKTRPPLTRLRRSIFDFLNPYLYESQYLDLFSGTGSYLFEAVSRGAKSALGIELDERLAESINDQAARLMVSNRLVCLADDVFEALESMGKENEKFDLIMIAPPQYRGLIDRALVLIKEHSVFSGNGIIICQHDTSESLKIDFSPFNIEQRRKYGNTTFTILS
jgi:16S rRNA (guanine(966)-N(2))-methyltransferase RsmD